MAGNRTAHRQAEDAARQRPGEGSLGSRADYQLTEGTEAAASAVRSARRSHGRLGGTGFQRHLLPHPPSRPCIIGAIPGGVWGSIYGSRLERVQATLSRISIGAPIVIDVGSPRNVDSLVP